MPPDLYFTDKDAEMYLEGNAAAKGCAVLAAEIKRQAVEEKELADEEDGEGGAGDEEEGFHGNPDVWEVLDFKPAPIFGNGKAVFPARTPIPAEGTTVFTTAEDYEKQIEVTLTETMEYHGKPVAKITIEGINKHLARVPKIYITFKLDASGVLTTTAMDATNPLEPIDLKQTLDRGIDGLTTGTEPKPKAAEPAPAAEAAASTAVASVFQAQRGFNFTSIGFFCISAAALGYGMAWYKNKKQDYSFDEL